MTANGIRRPGGRPEKVNHGRITSGSRSQVAYNESNLKIPQIHRRFFSENFLLTNYSGNRNIKMI